ncbi:MAG: hypothetical protein NVV66_10100 [Cellulomonas sp.]|uniref:hypothetical protein n=1 Tax=Cellulomonas sp. TaxID=40001 RepID=UPI00258442CD|nr:hypothetical protein [Cellulomonas sp.]MCR6705024.1 hypothetical protein [Cellulomonas sp.]
MTADITADTDWDPAAQTVYLVEGSVAVLGGATLRIGPERRDQGRRFGCDPRRGRVGG